MGRLTWLVLVVAGLWSGWWWIGSTAEEKAMRAWLDSLRADGWEVKVGDLALHGFPNRFDTTLTDVVLGDPAARVTWRAPFFQLLSLAYRPHRVIAVWPHTQTLEVPGQTLRLDSERARGSVFLDPSSSFALGQITIVVNAPSVTSSLGWSVSASEVRLAAARAPVAEAEYRIGAEADAVVLPPGLLERIEPAGGFSGTLDRLHLDATLTFAAPLDRTAIETTPPRITAIRLADASLAWDGVTLAADGTLTVTPGGLPEGTLSVRADGWRQLLSVAESAGLIDAGTSGALDQGLGALSALATPPGRITVPLTFRNGEILLGAVPLGPAPRLLVR